MEIEPVMILTAKEADAIRRILTSYAPEHFQKLSRNDLFGIGLASDVHNLVEFTVKCFILGIGSDGGDNYKDLTSHAG